MTKRDPQRLESTGTALLHFTAAVWAHAKCGDPSTHTNTNTHHSVCGGLAKVKVEGAAPHWTQDHPHMQGNLLSSPPLCPQASSTRSLYLNTGNGVKVEDPPLRPLHQQVAPPSYHLPTPNYGHRGQDYFRWLREGRP